MASSPARCCVSKKGTPVTVDIFNDTDTPELVHWHGQIIPTDVDGSAEEGTPYVPAHGMRRITLTPKPAGFRFYHPHVVAEGDLNRGTYSGQAGPVYIEPKNDPGAYDREIFLTLKEFEPTFSQGGDMAMDFLTGHSFRVVSLDRNPVPNPADVPVLWIGTAERISAIVEMHHPGVWVMGDLADDDRGHGMGIVVEYSGRSRQAAMGQAQALPLGLHDLRQNSSD